jgi:serine/threonine-protein kinase
MVDLSAPDVPEEEATLPAGARLGKYQIVRLLGAGGMGAVYEATHSEIGKRVAIKTLSPAIAAIPGARQRFLREAQLTSRLSHPNIVDLTDMGTEGRIAYLVMEMLQGEDLSQRLDRTGPMNPQQLIDLLLPVCAAIQTAHEAGIVHRDLKPQNIFLETGRQGITPKVLDFGISKSSDTDSSSSLTGTGSVIGTPNYLAPEQIKDARTAGAHSDQYSIGVILYRCLSNANPFEGDSLFAVLQAIVTEKPMPLAERRPDLPTVLVRVVERAMSPLPYARFPSVRDLGHALLPFATPKARVIWEDTFPEGAPAPAPAAEPELPRGSATMPNPTPMQPKFRSAAAISTAKSTLDASGTLSPAVTSTNQLYSSSGGRGRVIGGLVAGLAVAVGGFLFFSRGASTPQPVAPPVAATPAPAAAPPPPAAVAPVAPPPVAPAPAPPKSEPEKVVESAKVEAPAKVEEAAKVDEPSKKQTGGAKERPTPAKHRSSPHRAAPAAPAAPRGYSAPVLD